MGFLFLLSICCVLVPSEAYGWGPATHLYYAKEALHFGQFLPPAIRMLLSNYPGDFLYGCIAADITLGKKFIEYIYNCHNFEVGMSLLGHAHSDPHRAFVYGYLSHLAADTVSHNFFVPYQNIRHFDNATFRHAYWEVRLDQYFADRVWKDIESVIQNPRTHSHDRLLDGALKDTLFSFRTNKILFSSMLAIQRLKKWRLFVNKINKASKMQFNPQHLAEYNRLAVSAIIRLFNEGKDSCVFRVDPTGMKTIEEAQAVRKSLRSLKRRHELTQAILEEECQRFRAHTRHLHFESYPIESNDFKPSIHMKI